MNRTILAAALSLALVAPAHAFTGNDLLATCDSDKAALGGFCIGYISGIAAGAPAVCTPQGVTRGQQRDLVVNTIRGVPQIRHMPARVLVEAALLEAGWKCEADQAPAPSTSRKQRTF